MPNLVIASKQIRQLDGLFNLNDLHKASGGEDRHRPTRFMRLDQTQELIQEIIKENDKCPDMDTFEPAKTIKGCKGGTFVCEQLFIAFAAWISARIHLQAINALLEKHNLLEGKPATQSSTKPKAERDQLITLHKSVFTQTGQAIVKLNNDGTSTAKPVNPNTTHYLLTEREGQPPKLEPLTPELLGNLVIQFLH